MIVLFTQIACTVCGMAVARQPFPEVLKDLLAEQEVSGRELTRRCRNRYGWGSIRTIADLVNGDLRPSETAMENIAGALGVSPKVFVEYRLLKVRQQFDPDSVGFKKAAKNLEHYEVIQGAEDAVEKPPKAPGRRRGGRKGRSASS